MQAVCSAYWINYGKYNSLKYLILKPGINTRQKSFLDIAFLDISRNKSISVR